MSDATDGSNHTSTPLYARFSRRVRGMFIDWLMMVGVIFSALFLAIAVDNHNFSRVLGALVVGAILLYEPVLVSSTGGTVGHYFTNLRVVDDANRGNVTFLKAVVQSIIKVILGWYSFLVISATRRNQALHDVLTRSTVQIRDSAKASQHQYITERVEHLDGSMPSRLRRVAVIVVYLLLALVVCTVANYALFLAGLISRGCAYADRCVGVEEIAMLLIVAIWFAVSALCIGLGWRGKLFGARRKA